MSPAVDSKIYSTWLATCQKINVCPERWTWTSAWKAACSRLLRLLSDNSRNTEPKVTVLLLSQHSVHGEELCPWLKSLNFCLCPLYLYPGSVCASHKYICSIFIYLNLRQTLIRYNSNAMRNITPAFKELTK